MWLKPDSVISHQILDTTTILLSSLSRFLSNFVFFFIWSGKEMFLTWYCCVGTCWRSDKRSCEAALIQISACSQSMGASTGTQIQRDNLSVERKGRVCTLLCGWWEGFCRISYILIFAPNQNKYIISEKNFSFWVFDFYIKKKNLHDLGF